MFNIEHITNNCRRDFLTKTKLASLVFKNRYVPRYIFVISTQI